MKLNVNGVVRDATSVEVAVIEATQADMERETAAQLAAQEAARAAKASAKAKLSALGLTDAEIASLLGV